MCLNGVYFGPAFSHAAVARQMGIWSASTARRSFQTMRLRASVILSLWTGKKVTRSNANATGGDDAENCFDRSTFSGVLQSSPLPAVRQNFDSCLSRIAPLSFSGFQSRPHIQVSKPLVPSGNVGFRFEESNRQIQELEPQVTYRKQWTPSNSNRQETQKRVSEFLSRLLSRERPLSWPGRSQGRPPEVSSR